MQVVENLERSKFWLAITMFVLQGFGTAYYMGSQMEALKAELIVARRDLNKLETNQVLLLQVVRDVAILQVRDVEFEKRLEKAERK